MKQGSSNRRSRSRGGNKRNPGGGRNNFESNGPDVKIRGSAQQVQEKYQALARDAASAGDRVTSEAYLQYAEHYFRVSNPEGGNGKVQGQGQNQGQNQSQGQNQNQGQNKPRRTDKPHAPRAVQETEIPKAPDNGPGDSSAADAPQEQIEFIDTSPAALAAAVSEREAAEAKAKKSADKAKPATEPVAS